MIVKSPSMTFCQFHTMESHVGGLSMKSRKMLLYEAARFRILIRDPTEIGH